MHEYYICEREKQMIIQSFPQLIDLMNALDFQIEGISVTRLYFKDSWEFSIDVVKRINNELPIGSEIGYITRSIKEEDSGFEYLFEQPIKDLIIKGIAIFEPDLDNRILHPNLINELKKVMKKNPSKKKEDKVNFTFSTKERRAKNDS